MSSVEHILLYLFLYCCLILCDSAYRTTNTEKRKKATLLFTLLSVAAYVAVEGFRYGRGVDYFGYGPLYMHCFERSIDQPGFEFIMKTIKTFDLSSTLPYGICFHGYALIFIVCLFVFYKNFHEKTKYFLFFACLATLYMTEWTIRQGVSMSLFLPGIYFLQRKKYAYTALFVLMSLSVHYGNAVAIAIVIACFLVLNKKPLPALVTVPLFIVLQSVFQMVMPYIETYIAMLDLSALGGNFQGYIDNYDNLMGAGAMERVESDWTRSRFASLTTNLYYCSLLITGYIVHKKYSQNVFLYNSFVICILVVEPFRLLANFTRPFLLGSILWFVPFSIATYYYKEISRNKLFKITYCLVIAYLVMYYGRYVFLNPEAKYVWDV